MNTAQRSLLYLFALVALIIGLIVTSIPPVILLLVFLIVVTLFFFLVSAILAFLSGNARRVNREPSEPAESAAPPLNPTLLSVRAFWPFDFFPDVMIVGENEITVVRKVFFFSGWTESAPVSEIRQVVLYRGPFFSSLTLLQKSKESIHVGYLRNNDALNAKEIIDGLLLKREGRVEIPEKAPLPVRKKRLKQAGRQPAPEKEALEKPL